MALILTLIVRVNIEALQGNSFGSELCCNPTQITNHFFIYIYFGFLT